ncbi:hypothetical protein K493DRAFT_306618 [Basidiobolus meristosporus CBS 931.73]|uniref:Uncharacterized protein n=1 Tax=Basidiobolus meristosporus CBS 931.73 TaxID=1314790 RepID=A0A1Y1XRS1_9FUNG|nr:hypothetical protein K493DRAFT_306618 [Basidiobolus meristosporus CBS 931.73]|eukprot:ORX88433.1 hypothetical protein K493DRAFT_306618 [Basidiobolus meristosporus CBS 931.73]
MLRQQALPIALLMAALTMGAQLHSTTDPASLGNVASGSAASESLGPAQNPGDGYTVREFKSNKKEDASRIMSLILQQMTNSIHKKEYPPLSNMLDMDDANTGAASDPKAPPVETGDVGEGEDTAEMNPEEAELWGRYGRWRRGYWGRGRFGRYGGYNRWGGGRYGGCYDWDC